MGILVSVLPVLLDPLGSLAVRLLRAAALAIEHDLQGLAAMADSADSQTEFEDRRGSKA